MLLLRIISVVSLSLLAASAISAQISPYPDNILVNPNVRPRTEIEKDQLRRANELKTAVDRLNRSRVPQSSKRDAEMRETAKTLLLPSAEVGIRYGTLLSRQGTGIVRLFSTTSCLQEGQPTEAITKSCASRFIPGNAQFFSFRRRDYVEPSLADVGMMNDLIFSLGSLNQGILVRLGEVSVEEVAAETPGLNFIWNFVPSSDLLGAANQMSALTNGQTAAGFSYSNVLKLESDVTYGLRVVAYSPFFLLSKRKSKKTESDPTRVFPFGDDVRIDLTVAFRFVEKNADGSYVMVWKELRRLESPQIMVPEPN